jgi:hypothetical protein
MSFIRRYTTFPAPSVLSAIEGAVIVDLPPPGSISGVGTGVACLVGEFVDMTYATAVSSAGVVSTSPQPVEVYSAQDIIDKLGGFDSTIGQFGKDGGNGFVELRSKPFSRLVVVPINLCSATGLRVWRHLPGCTSATNANPVVPVVDAVVSAGREFKDGSHRMRLGKSVAFTSAAPLCSAVDGVQVAAGPLATMTFTSATAAFVTHGCAKGDILQQGVIGGPGVPGTYRIVAVGSETSLTVEAMDGANLTWAGVTALPFRVHPAATADIGGATQLSEQAGCLVPCRPLDASITTATSFPPTVVPTAETASTCDPLSGLGAHAVAAVTYTSTIQAANAPNDATIDALYALAIASLISEAAPASDVNILWTARKSSTIRATAYAHVLQACAGPHGRLFISAPETDNVTLSTIIGASDPGVGAHRDEIVPYTWPGAQMFVPEAAGVLVTTATGTTTDGILDVAMDGFMSSILSTLASERNPGESSTVTKAALSAVLGYQRGCPTLGMAEFIALKQAGVAALKMDRNVGAVIQSGVTSSLVAGQKNINRRRMAFEIEDSIAARLVQFSKLPLTNGLKDAMVMEVMAYMDGLLSDNNPAAQRIADYNVDAKNGNTPTLTAANIYVIIVRAQTLATADTIVCQVQASESAITVSAT